MDEGYKKLIERHRDKFRRAITVERLLSPLVVSHVVSAEEAQSIQSEHPAQRVDRLLDVIQRKDHETFKKFCVVLETTYPYMLNCMFLGVEPPTTSVSQHIRNDQGKTADSNEDTTRHMQCIGPSRRVNVGRSTSMTGHDLCKDRVIGLKNELRAVKRDLEKVTAQLHETEAQRDAFKKMIDHKTGDRLHMEGNPNSQGSERDNDYDILKKQYIDNLRELEMLRYEHSDISAKYDSVCQQCENSRKYKMLFQTLQRRVDEMNLERDKLKQEYEEIVLLREREKIELIEMKDNQQYEEYLNSQSGNKSFEKYETHQKDYESLQDVHRELRTEYNHLFNSFQNLESDYSALKIQFDGLIHERDSLIIERNGLKQQSEAAVKKYEKAMKDCDTVVKRSFQDKQQLEQQYDLARRECDQVMSLQVKTAKDITKLTEERNAALNEYQLVMSERDTVHREIEKLHDELTDMRKTNESLQKDYSKLQNHFDDTQGEMSLLVEEREQVAKEALKLKERLSQALLEKDSLVKERDKVREDCEMFKQERNVARRERSEAIIHRDKILKECFEIKQKHQLVLKGENEVEALRRQFEVLSKELTDALHDVEVVKMRRDWALTERDKVIQDRDSLKIRFDKMQRERDRAVSDLAELLQESDHIRRKHSEAVGELLELRQHIESQLKQGNLPQELVSSRDSAIDTDSNEWETESVVLERMNIDDDLGIAIAGGTDTPAIPNDSSIVITNVAKGSIADGKLRVNDCVLKVNNVDLTNVKYCTAVQAISRGEVVNMTVKRKRSTGLRPLLVPVSLMLTNNREMGIRVDSENHISSIVPGSVAADEGRIAVGDKIITINGTSVENLNQSEVESLLSTSLLSLTVQKLSTTSSRTQVLQSLLEEVNDRINRENDICRKAQLTKERITNSGSLSELQQESSSAYFSGKSSPLPDDQMSSTPESISEPVLQSLSSLTPLYEENPEMLNRKQTDSSGDLSTEEGSASPLVASSAGSNKRSQAFVKLRKSLVRSSPFTQSPRLSMPVQLTYKERPVPPMRSCSYMSAITSPPQGEEDNVHSQEDDAPTFSPPLGSTAHYPSNYFHDSSIVNTSNTVVTRKKTDSHFRGSRPQSAPSSRQHQIALGSSPGSSGFGRYSSSHEDPFALTPPRPNSSTPPATVAVLRSTSVPYYTAKSRSVQSCEGLPAVSQQCLPVQCDRKQKKSRLKTDPFGKGRHSRQGSSHSADGDSRNRQCLSMYDYDTPSKAKRRPQRINLPTSRARVTSYPSAGTSSYCSSSVSSTYSISSGHTTPVVIPSTPIVPATETGPALAFDFSNPPESGEDPLNRDYEPRLVTIEKKDTLGISIAAACQGGVFVSSVNEGSVAAKAGLKCGDQLLEYNGVNLRCATYDQAAMILKQSGNSVTILAQFNPEKFKDTTESLSSQSEATTTCSTPINRKRRGSSNTPPIRRNGEILPIIDNEPPGDLRYVFFTKSPSSLGFSIAGGNAMGIFVSEIQPDDTAANSSGLKVGDHILELNGVDLTSVTAEQAMLELCKPTETVQILAQFNPTKFNSLRDQPGDSFYVRALFDRIPHSKDEVNFKKGDILFVTDTMYNGHMGCWRACLVNEEDTQKRDIGMIPSRMKAEQELLLRRSVALAHGEDYKLTGRRSFFRRSKKGTHGVAVNHSREGSDSATSITTSCPDLGIASYQTVEKLDTHIPRAVILFSPMVEVLYEKLSEEVPYKFVQCKPELVNLPQEKVEKGIADGTFVDSAWKGHQLACTTMASIKQVTDKHSLLDVSPSAVERLHALQVYPIILFVKFKSPKHIRDQKDGRYIREKISLRRAKELFESSAKLEREYKHFFNGTVHCTGNLSNICSQIQEVVDEQQKKAVWVPLSSV